MNFLMLFVAVCFARESLYKREEPKVIEKVESRDSALSPKTTKKLSTPSSTGSRVFGGAGNLDQDILVLNSTFRPEGAGEINPKTLPITKYKKIKPGDVVMAELKEPIIAFPDSKTPVRAVVRWGDLRGVILLGEASLEKNSKNVAINFDRLVSPQEKEVFPMKGYVLAEGTHHTNEERYFLAELLSAAAAGFVDAGINRSQNAYGNYVEEPGVNTSSRKAVGAAASKSAERFAERARNAPEWTLIKSNTTVQVLVVE
ncbi:hypothetical protein ACLVWU_08680 [Bdellovibrio sp. HCB290]|uniref:hypothetical protein n=1 Tax=Bdellovibrio sp. HCB290 TaxID=3394356 RepID=UPI0039B3BC32